MENKQVNTRLRELNDGKTQALEQASNIAALTKVVQDKTAMLEDKLQIIKQLQYQCTVYDQEKSRKAAEIEMKKLETMNLERDLQELKRQVGTVTLSIAEKKQSSKNKQRKEEIANNLLALEQEAAQLKTQEKNVEFQHSRIKTSIEKHEQDIKMYVD